MTIAKVKRTLSRATRVPPERLQLFLNGLLLQDSLTPADVDLTEDAVVRMRFLREEDGAFEMDERWVQEQQSKGQQQVMKDEVERQQRDRSRSPSPGGGRRRHPYIDAGVSEPRPRAESGDGYGYGTGGGYGYDAPPPSAGPAVRTGAAPPTAARDTVAAPPAKGV